MTRKHDTGKGHHKSSDPCSISSGDCKLATGKDEQFPSETMKNEDIIDIIDELAAMRPPNQLRSSIPESTLYRISKIVTNEAVEDKKVELMRSDTMIPAKDVDVLCLIDTSDLYGLINDGINKYNDRNTVQGFINDMVGNINVLTVVKSSNKATATRKLGTAKSVIVQENNHDNTKLADTGLKSNNILGAHIVEENQGRFYGWAVIYDE